MSKQPDTIPKQPLLKPAEDYYRLRREGIGFIADMGSRLWTDYNTHDPGITILEALCFTITDLAYRTGWDIKDILTPEIKPQDLTQPYPNQAFFTAKDILTVNPTTPDDFRRLLIDLDGVRNAWVFCKLCACDATLYAWRDENKQCHVEYTKPQNIPEADLSKIQPQGLYDVLLELEADRELGDLNDRKIIRTVTIFDSKLTAYLFTLELRFPAWELINQAEYDNFIDLSKTIDSLNKPLSIDDESLKKAWQGIFYFSFEITLKTPAGVAISVNISNVRLRLFGDEAAKKTLETSEELKTELNEKLYENTDSGFVHKYRRKLVEEKNQLELAKSSLYSHRNLDEDYCTIKVVGIEDVAVCADIEVTPDADIERVQAQIWFEIEQHFNPPVPFYSLQEMQNAGLAVESIFNGPKLENGFLKTEDLQAAGLKTVLRTSDIVNRLMHIEGLVAINYLALSKYDAQGNIVKGAADPDSETGNFDPDKISASWQLSTSVYHQPRFHRLLSRFLFFKNGLPFMARTDEALDTLTQLQGPAERPKIKNAAKDLPVPAGSFRKPETYFPVQHSFPLTYGIGPAGLPSHASSQRQAQAKQLKAFLLAFEQLLGNAFSQLAHTADLFSLDTSIRRTYFVQEFSEKIIKGYKDLIDKLDMSALESMTESAPEFLERRNRFLDHIMARFGEQFGEYALLLSDYQGQQIALDRLINDKIAFLKAYPVISHDRAKAFNYKTDPCAANNVSGLAKRISLLLGFRELGFYWSADSANGQQKNRPIQLKDRNGEVKFEIQPPETVTKAQDTLLSVFTEEDKLSLQKIEYQNGQIQTVLKDQCCQPVIPKQETLNPDQKAGMDKLGKALQECIMPMIQAQALELVQLETSQFQLQLKDADGKVLGESGLINTETEAKQLQQELLGWSANQRVIIVEHLLLRPKFPGDAFDSIYQEGNCSPCGDEDAYSFRLSYVMPGWAAPYNSNMAMRNFAERTIRQETPAHLLCKICWIGNDGFDGLVNDCIINHVFELLVPKGSISEDKCSKVLKEATNVVESFNKVFKDWYQDKTLNLTMPEALNEGLAKEFSKISRDKDLSIISDAMWAEIQKTLLKYFQERAVNGWQFDRFEDAWCRWLAANAKIDWMEERLLERVQTTLEARLITGQKKNLCNCAAAILAQFGQDFNEWIERNVKQENTPDKFTDFSPNKISLFEVGVTAPLANPCEGLEFEPGTSAAIETLLKARYQGYKEVSFRLKILLNQLGNLHSIYPAATLHDCDDGNDQNPVRLGSTVLGNVL
jgi:hypothetical protein